MVLNCCRISRSFGYVSNIILPCFMTLILYLQKRTGRDISASRNAGNDLPDVMEAVEDFCTLKEISQSEAKASRMIGNVLEQIDQVWRSINAEATYGDRFAAHFSSNLSANAASGPSEIDSIPSPASIQPSDDVRQSKRSPVKRKAESQSVIIDNSGLAVPDISNKRSRGSKCNSLLYFKDAESDLL